MSGASFTETDAERRIEAYKEDVGKFTGALEDIEDEERAKSTRASIADGLRQVALLSLFLEDHAEAAENFGKATDWYLEQLEAVADSETLALEGGDGARTLADLVAVAVLSGEDRRSEASAACLDATVEAADEDEPLLAYAKLLAALVGDGDVDDRLAAAEADAEAGPDFLPSAVAAVRGIHEADPIAVVEAIEEVLATHPGEGALPPRIPLSLDALALYTIARERALVSHGDISTAENSLPEYRPEDH